MKLLITGGAGFIGSALIRHLIEHTEHSVINVDKLTYAGNLANVASVSGSPRYVFEQVDICHRQALDRVFRQHQPDAVMHLAAESHVDNSIHCADAFIQTNVVGTHTLLQASCDYFFRLPETQKQRFRFHHISTDEVYGTLDFSQPPCKESTPYAPTNPYAASKASSDHLVRAWHQTHGLPTVISHCCNNYGPFQHPEKLIALTISNALSGKPLPIYGHGLQIRDWLFVQDHVRALIMIVLQGKIGESYHISGHNEQSNLAVVNKICELLEELAPNKPQNVQHYRDLITHVADRAGHDQRYALDARKIQQQLGWQAQQDFDSGLRQTVQWYVQQRDEGKHGFE